MATKKAQPKGKKKALQIVSVEEVPADEQKTATPDQVLTPEQYVRNALAYAKEAVSCVERASYALEDGAKFFKVFDDARRGQLVKTIIDYMQKADFGASSLADEIQIALGEAPAARKRATLPKLEVQVPAVSAVQPAAPGGVSLETIEQTATLLELNLIMLHEMEISGSNAERAVQVQQFVRGMLLDARAAAAALKGAA